MEKKAHRGRIWKVKGNERFLRGMWENFTLERAAAREILADAFREKQEGIQGQWQQESPFREVWNKSREVRDAEWSSNDASRPLCNEEW